MTKPQKLTFHDGSCCNCGTEDRLIRISEFGKAVCRDCFPVFVQRRIATTIRRFQMVPPNKRLCVAVSGGADSGMLLHALGQLRGQLTFRLMAVHIDMGIGDGYSQQCRSVVRQQSDVAGVSVEIESVKNYDIQIRPVGDWPVCAVCGAVRRTLLSRVAMRNDADILAVGHSLDDQLQFLLRNILSGKATGPPPVRPATEFSPMKVKPLIQIPDSAGSEYVDIVDMPVVEKQCPQFDPQTHRFKQVFNLLEQQAPMAKLQFFHVLRKVMEPEETDNEQAHPCPECGEPTTMRICPICRLLKAQQGDK